MIGKTISHFQITGKLGQGGMGEVYLADDTSLERKVALKFLPEDLQQDEAAHRRFLREAKSAAAIDHPFICNIFEIGQVKGQDFIAMEYVQGQTLKDRLKANPLSLETGLQIASEIAEALEVAHQNGIVHRDLKPSNIMLTPQGHAKIMDFGLAKQLSAEAMGDQKGTLTELTKQGTTPGTPAYMSPEQLKGQQLDPRSDIFSFGIILYEMLTGIHPFRRPGTVETMGSILHQEPEPLAEYITTGVNSTLQEMISKMLAKNPNDRYRSVTEVSTLLDLVSSSSKSIQEPFWIGARFGGLLIAVVVVVALIALFGWWGLREETPESALKIKSIAVLPLVNLSGDPKQEHFADGMTEALITSLGSISALRVIARTSVMGYKGTDLQLADIALELGVEAIIEGSALREGNEAGITVRLIEVSTEAQLWSQAYQRDLHNLIVLHNELARTIAGEIEAVVTPEEEIQLASARQVNPEAYDAYLMGRQLLSEGKTASYPKALEYFERACEIDPNFALGYAGQAESYAWMSGETQLSPSHSWPEARRAAKKALAINASLPEAHFVLAWYQFQYDFNFEEAEKSFRRVIALNPNNAEARNTYSWLLNALGRNDEALEQIRLAAELNPFSFSIMYNKAWALHDTGSYEDAQIIIKEMIATEPDSRAGYFVLAVSRFMEGDFEQAVAVLQTALALIAKDKPPVETLLTQALLGHTYGLLGRKDDARGMLGELKQAAASGVYVSPIFESWIYAGLGEKETALDLLEQSYESHENYIPYLNIDPWYDPIRDEPRFKNLVKKLKLPPGTR